MAMQRRLLRLGAQPVPPPESVMRRFQDESDPVRKFLSEMTVADGTIEPTPLHAAYVRWCKEDGGREPLGRSDFGDRVTEAGFPVRKSNGRRVRDLRLRLDSDEEASDRDAGDGSGDKKLLPIQKTDEGKGSREALLENNDPNDPVVVDLETADARDLYRYGPGFVRLVGVDGGIGTDPGAVVRSISAGVPAVAHNGLAFDFAALARYHGLDYLAAVDAGLLIDSKVLAVLHDPPGARMRGPARYYGLDATAERLGVRGKVADLKALARKHGGYDRIPVDDPEYREYLRGDVAATRAVFDLMGMSDYARREMRVMGRLNFAMRVTGWRVDAPLLAARIAAGQRVVDAGMQVLVAHGLPVVKADGSPSKRPHTTKPGREAVAAALAAAGVRSWPVTAGGALALGRDAWGGFEVPDAARALLEAVWSMNGVRTVYQTVDDHRTGDRVYSTVDPYQASGRLSIKDPGLTVMGKRGGRHVEREVFLPEPGCSMIAFDLNQVDARAVAMHSQDPAYMALFNDPGIDSHAEIAHMIWGDRSMREAAKAIGHGWNYGESLARISAEAGVPLEVAKEFDRRMREQFPRLVEWQAEVRALAESGAMLDNGFGRLMRPDPARAWTQGPALMGQGLARDLLAEGLLRLPAEVVGFLRGSIHDELCFSVPTDSVVDVSRVVLEAMQFEYRGVAVTAGATRPGPTWGHIYRKDGA
jgi:DNA polymerase-1